MKLRLAAVESLTPSVAEYALDQWLGSDEQARSQRLSVRRGKEYIVGRILLRQLLSELAGVAPQSWCIVERPDLPPDIPAATALNLSFSVSHSKGIVAVVVSDVQPVSVDLEVFSPRDFLALAGYYFHPSESAMLSRLDGLERQAEFYRLWTQKEACIKLQLGSVFSDLPRRLTFSNQRLRVAEEAPRFALSCHCCDNFALSVASDSAGSHEEIVVDAVGLSNWPLLLNSKSSTVLERPVFRRYDGWL